MIERLQPRHVLMAQEKVYSSLKTYSLLQTDLWTVTYLRVPSIASDPA